MATASKAQRPFTCMYPLFEQGLAMYRHRGKQLHPRYRADTRRTSLAPISPAYTRETEEYQRFLAPVLECTLWWRIVTLLLTERSEQEMVRKRSIYSFSVDISQCPCVQSALRPAPAPLRQQPGQQACFREKDHAAAVSHSSRRQTGAALHPTSSILGQQS